MKFVVADSCVFVSLFVQKDINHREAIEILKNASEKGVKFLIPTLALPEVCGAIARVTGDKRYAREVKKKMEKWIEIGFLVVKELTLKRMELACEASIELGIKGADAVFISLTKEFNAEFLSFDKEVNRKIKNKVKLYKFLTS